MTQGIYDVSKKAYHADTLHDHAGELLDERPALSSGIASLLVSKSPLHAWAAHPKLNPDFEPVEKDAFDIGTVAHDLLLEGTDIVVGVDAKDWRTKAAQEARIAAREAGKVALLTHQIENVTQMIQAVNDQLAEHKALPPLFKDGAAEQTLVWEEDGILCKARLDWLRDDRAAIDDLKTTSASANPTVYSRNLFGVGGDVQAAFYLRGMAAVFGPKTATEVVLGLEAEGKSVYDDPTPPQFRWVIVETSPPYAVSVVSPSPAILTIAEKKVDFALALWKLCLENDHWPGYSDEVCFAELPPWIEEQWLEKELREAPNA